MAPLPEELHIPKIVSLPIFSKDSNRVVTISTFMMNYEYSPADPAAYIPIKVIMPRLTFDTVMAGALGANHRITKREELHALLSAASARLYINGVSYVATGQKIEWRAIEALVVFFMITAARQVYHMAKAKELTLAQIDAKRELFKKGNSVTKAICALWQPVSSRLYGGSDTYLADIRKWLVEQFSTTTGQALLTVTESYGFASAIVHGGLTTAHLHNLVSEHDVAVRNALNVMEPQDNQNVDFVTDL
jgi:hypothetical protein